jgi:aminoglycoside/choline kinase family phosphotransferase
MRDRWFGATGKRVPEIVLEGELDLAGALVLDDVGDEQRLREAHAAGTPVVVRAADPQSITRALARPEVACVLVPADRADLRDLDLRRITYGQEA